MRPHQYLDYIVLVDPASLTASQQKYHHPSLSPSPQTLCIYGNGEPLSGSKSSMNWHPPSIHHIC